MRRYLGTLSERFMFGLGVLLLLLASLMAVTGYFGEALVTVGVGTIIVTVSFYGTAAYNAGWMSGRAASLFFLLSLRESHQRGLTVQEWLAAEGEHDDTGRRE